MERLWNVDYGGAALSPRDALTLTVDFIVRVVNHADGLCERDAMKLGSLFVEKLDAYLDARELTRARGGT